jgi:hypothetical protein
MKDHAKISLTWGEIEVLRTAIKTAWHQTSEGAPIAQMYVDLLDNIEKQAELMRTRLGQPS